MIYILIILATGTGKGAVDHVEFNSQGACVMAQADIKRAAKETLFSVETVCVPKG